MADKMAELKAALEGISLDALKLVLEFTEFLKKHAEKIEKRE